MWAQCCRHLCWDKFRFHHPGKKFPGYFWHVQIQMCRAVTLCWLVLSSYDTMYWFPRVAVTLRQKIQCLKVVGIHILIGLESGSLKAKVRVGQCSLRRPFLGRAFPQSSYIACWHHRHLLTCSPITQTSLCLRYLSWNSSHEAICKFSFLPNTSHWIPVHSDPMWPFQNLNAPLETQFQMKSHS